MIRYIIRLFLDRGLYFTMSVRERCVLVHYLASRCIEKGIWP